MFLYFYFINNRFYFGGNFVVVYLDGILMLFVMISIINK